jgi:hypothetical protein
MVTHYILEYITNSFKSLHRKDISGHGEMVQKERAANYTNKDPLIAMGKSKDVNERIKLTELMYHNPEMTTSLPKRLVEALANDENLVIRAKICNNRDAINMLSVPTILARIDDESYMVRQLILSKEEATQKLTRTKLTSIASRLIISLERGSRSAILEITSMIENEDVKKRLPADTMKRLTEIESKASFAVVDDTDEHDSELDFAELRKALEKGIGGKKAN